MLNMFGVATILSSLSPKADGTRLVSKGLSAVTLIWANEFLYRRLDSTKLTSTPRFDGIDLLCSDARQQSISHSYCRDTGN